jgi:hypothetical protein
MARTFNQTEVFVGVAALTGTISSSAECSGRRVGPRGGLIVPEEAALLISSLNAGRIGF